MKKIFLEELRKRSIELNDEKLEEFESYKNLIEDWNRFTDITNILGEEIYSKHFADSISLYATGLIEKNQKIIDIGSGGGFPGIPLKLVNDSLKIDLLDSLNKRVKFLNEVISSLKLSDIRAIHGRCEELGRKDTYREKYDIAVSRAVANMRTLSEYCLPFIKLGGYFIAMKGPSGIEELEEAKKAIEILGGVVRGIEDFEIDGNRRILISVKKVKRTPPSYPRGQGKPRKKPL